MLQGSRDRAAVALRHVRRHRREGRHETGHVLDVQRRRRSGPGPDVPAHPDRVSDLRWQWDADHRPVPDVSRRGAHPVDRQAHDHGSAGRELGAPAPPHRQGRPGGSRRAGGRSLRAPARGGARDVPQRRRGDPVDASRELPAGLPRSLAQDPDRARRGDPRGSQGNAVGEGVQAARQGRAGHRPAGRLRGSPRAGHRRGAWLAVGGRGGADPEARRAPGPQSVRQGFLARHPGPADEQRPSADATLLRGAKCRRYRRSSAGSQR